MKVLEITPFSFVLPKNSPIYRVPPREEGLRDLEYNTGYDYSSVFYDVFYSSDKTRILCVGPELRNLVGMIDASVIKLSDNTGVYEKEYEIVDSHHVSKLVVETDCDTEYRAIEIHNDLGAFKIPVGENYSSCLKGKNVLVTVNKNNKIQWINDWISINAKINNINALLLFDNDSTDYTSQELMQGIACNPDIDVLILVHAPFLYGPQGGKWPSIAKHLGVNVPWDSNYLQYALLEIAHHRFLKEANFVINCDVDEVFIPQTDTTLEEELNASKDGIVYVGQYQLRPVQKNQSIYNGYSASDFFIPIFCVGHSNTCKYAYLPPKVSDQDVLEVHKIINGKKRGINKKFIFRHFMSINTGWKAKTRLDVLEFNESEYFFDCNLFKIFSKLKINGKRYPAADILEYARQVGACPRNRAIDESCNTNAAFECDGCIHNQNRDVEPGEFAPIKV